MTPGWMPLQVFSSSFDHVANCPRYSSSEMLFNQPTSLVILNDGKITYVIIELANHSQTFHTKMKLMTVEKTDLTCTSSITQRFCKMAFELEILYLRTQFWDYHQVITSSKIENIRL